MAFSATDAAFEGFRIARERPLAIVAWAVLSVVLSALNGVALVLLVGEEGMAEFIRLSQTPPSDDPAAALALVSAMGRLSAVSLPFSLIQTALLSCAVYRAVLRPEERGLGYLKLGADEFRVLLAFAARILLWMGGVVLLGAVAGVLGAVSPVAAALFAAVSVFATVVLTVWIVWVRLSLAPVASFSERRLVVFGAWRATKGRFWPILGAYLLALVLAVIVALLGTVIVYAALFAVGGAGAEPDFSSLAGYFSPGMIVSTLLGGVLTALYSAIVYAPGAVIWRGLKAEGVSV